MISVLAARFDPKDFGKAVSKLSSEAGNRLRISLELPPKDWMKAQL